MSFCRIVCSVKVEGRHSQTKANIIKSCVTSGMTPLVTPSASMVTLDSENNSHVSRTTEMTPRDVWKPESIFAGGEWEVTYIASARLEHCAKPARGHRTGQPITFYMNAGNDLNFGHELPQVAPAHGNSGSRIIGTQGCDKRFPDRDRDALKERHCCIQIVTCGNPDAPRRRSSICSRHTVPSLRFERTLPNLGIVPRGKVTGDGVGDQPVSLHQQETNHQEIGTNRNHLSNCVY